MPGETFHLRAPDPRLGAERTRTLALVRAAVGAEAEVLEVGSTAVTGVIGKGDIDWLVRAPAGRFAEVRARLDVAFARNPDQLSTDIYQGYLVDSPLDVAIQCTVRGGPFDDFEPFLVALRTDPALITAYNALKRRFDGRSMDDYRAAKRAFIEDVLGGGA